MTTPENCPGFHNFPDLKSFLCKCPSCSKEIEIFSSEFDKEHVCKACGEKIDFTQCTIYGS